MIAFQHAGMHWVRDIHYYRDLSAECILPTQISHVINAAVLLSAWSAAASDIYISSRFLFFLARRGHAPQIFASLVRYPRDPHAAPAEPAQSDVGSDSESDEADAQSDVPVVRVEGPEDGEPEDDELHGVLKSPDFLSTHTVHVSVIPVSASTSTSTIASTSAAAWPAPTEDGLTREPAPEAPPTPLEGDVEQATPRKPWFVLPLNAVLGSAAVGLLAFLNVTGPGAQVVGVSPLYISQLKETDCCTGRRSTG